MKRITLFVLAFGLTGNIHAQIILNSLEEAFEFADKSSLAIHQARLQQLLSRKEESINKSNLYPKLNVFGTADYYPILPTQLIPEVLFGGSPDKFKKVQFGLPYSFSGGMELTIPIVNFEKWEQIKRYKLQSQQSDWSAKVNIETIHIQITQWYYQALLTRELVKINHNNLEVINQLMAILDERKTTGVLNPADYNRSKNLQLEVHLAGVEYEKNYQQSLIVLRQLLSLGDSTSVELRDSITAKSWQIVTLQPAITSRPAWKEAEFKRAVAELQLNESRKAILPKISLNSKYTYQWQLKPSPYQQINFDFSNIGLRMDWPLFQGHFYKSTREKNELQLGIARLQQQQTGNEIVRQQSEWGNSFQAAVKKGTLLQQKVDVAADNLRIAQLNMKEGVMEFEEFNNIFQEYQKSRIDYLQNLNDLIVYQLLLTLK